jgi:polysaccharide pyruvyl transferase WcaK-like protein
MEIAHFYAKTRNLGDLGSAYGIKDFVKELFVDASFTDFNLKNKFSAGLFSPIKLDDEYQYLILGGGGLFYSLKYQPSGWYFNIPFNTYKNLKLKKCFWGIGINSEYSSEKRWNITEKTKNSIKKYCDLTELVGARDTLTLYFLHDIGVHHAELVPCPSIYTLNDIQTIENSDSVAINLTDRSVDIQKLFQTVKNVIEYLKSNHLHPVFVIHDVDEDSFLYDFGKNLKVEVLKPRSHEGLMNIYKKQKFTIGMRGHSLLYSTGAEIPMISLSYNQKCDAHMELIYQTDYLVKHENIYSEKLIISKIDSLLQNYSAIKDSIKKSKYDFVELNKKFALKLLN